jgi:hypothetical protein
LPYISIINPVYRAEEVLDELVARITLSVESITTNYEIVLVDDRSPDASWVKMVEIANGNLKVKAVRLSRNFGQHYAITAGLDYAKGEWIVVMDCDLQDRTEEITKLYYKALEGYDAVLARRYERKDGHFTSYNERNHTNRGLWHQASPFDAGGEQAAHAGLRQADDLLPAGHAYALGHPRDPDHLQAPRPADVRAPAGRRQPDRLRVQLQGAGGAKRAGADLRARGGVYRQR